MKAYPKYKDSGVKWIGKIPEDWEVKKLKYNTYIKGRIGWQALRTEEFVDEGPFCVTGTDFLNGIINWDSCYHVSKERYEKDKFIQLRENDLLITKDGTIGKIALVKNLDEEACLNSGVFVTRPTNNDYLTKYMFWVLSSPIFIEFINFEKKGSTIAHLFQNVFENLPYPLPPILIQQQISLFLDNRTGKIDETIEKKKQLIKVLEEQRTAIINHAVTKGINPNVKMKDSGIEWLGEIPEHWEVKKLKYLTEKIGSGVTPRGGSDVYVDKGIPLLRSQNIHFQGIDLDDVVYITNEVHENMKGSKVHQGDILFNITGGSIGRCNFVDGQFIEANVNQHVCIIRPKSKEQTKLLNYLLSSNCGQSQIIHAQTGSGREGLNFEALGNFSFSIPPPQEQQEILQYLDQETAQIDRTITKIKKEIELLEEYHMALISEAVTGKIDVRGLA